MITVYTDGSAHPNPGPGGFGMVTVSDYGLEAVYSKQTNNTTNNREEIKAILRAMIDYGRMEDVVTVYSDSSYAVNTLTSWMFGWARNGWIKSDKKTPENLDLIQAYYELYQKGYRINLQKIKGHAGHKWNELADRLATGAVTEEEALKKYNG